MSDFEGPVETGEATSDSGEEFDGAVASEEESSSQDSTPAQDDREEDGLAALLATKGIPDARDGSRALPKPLVSKKTKKAAEAVSVAQKEPSAGSFSPELAEQFRQWKEAQLAAGADPQKVQGQANSIAAQMRIKERENKVLRAKLLEIERAKQAAQQAPVEENLPDPHEDPGAYAIAKLERLEKMLREKDEREQVQREVQQHLGKVNYARDLAIQYRENNPQVYDEAVMHLASATYEEMSDNIDQLAQNGMVDLNQDLQPQLVQLVARSMAAKMTQALDNGMNPGDALYRLAVARGYQPRQWFPPVQQQAPVAAPVAQQKPDARQEIELERQRQAKAASLSGVAAAGPGRLNLSRLSSMEDIDEYLEATKGVPMKELFKDKLIPGAR